MTLPTLPLDTTLLKPGLRLAIGLSGGADSVALTRALAALASELGLVLHLAHLHHGLRDEAADADQQFAAELAQSLNLPFHTHKVDTAAEAGQQHESSLHHESGKQHESIEEAARRLRYQWFRQLMAQGHFDAVATAHTLGDQAETVLGKFLRGAWTEGLSGIHPVVNFPEGRILRPLLAATRPQIEHYLQSLHQPWREDASNQDPAYTRNRIRHQLLPNLEQWNPKIRQHLANMAQVARDEEDYWQSEINRLAPQLLLSGRPVRGGGRASSTNPSDPAIAIDITRLAAQPPALQRRLLRYAANLLGASLSFEATDSLHQLASHGRSGQQLALPGPITAERTPRELRLSQSQPKPVPADPVELPIPGQASAFGWHFRVESTQTHPPAIIRNWRPGDRVTLRYSSGPRKLKEVLDRIKVTGNERTVWPVVEWQGQILWMQGAELQPHPGFKLIVERT